MRPLKSECGGPEKTGRWIKGHSPAVRALPDSDSPAPDADAVGYGSPRCTPRPPDEPLLGPGTGHAGPTHSWNAEVVSNQRGAKRGARRFGQEYISSYIRSVYPAPFKKYPSPGVRLV